MSIFSQKDFTGRNLTERTDMNGLTIYNSCFSQENPDTVIFPEGMTGVNFINCNLENCFIPAGNVVVGCETRRTLTQNDLNIWEVDADNNPLTVVDYMFHYKFNIPHPAPWDIPDAPVPVRINYRDTTRNVRA